MERFPFAIKPTLALVKYQTSVLTMTSIASYQILSSDTIFTATISTVGHGFTGPFCI